MFRVDHRYAALGSDRERQPHVIVLIQHYFDGNDKISRAEVLTILMTITTQLEHKSLDAHCITPVSVCVSLLLWTSLSLILESSVQLIHGNY